MSGGIYCICRVAGRKLWDLMSGSVSFLCEQVRRMMMAQVWDRAGTVLSLQARLRQVKQQLVIGHQNTVVSLLRRLACMEPVMGIYPTEIFTQDGQVISAPASHQRRVSSGVTEMLLRASPRAEARRGGSSLLVTFVPHLRVDCVPSQPFSCRTTDQVFVHMFQPQGVGGCLFGQFFLCLLLEHSIKSVSHGFIHQGIVSLQYRFQITKQKVISSDFQHFLRSSLYSLIFIWHMLI